MFCDHIKVPSKWSFKSYSSALERFTAGFRRSSLVERFSESGLVVLVIRE